MSLDAMRWALKEAPIKKTKTAIRNRMILTYLADRFNDDTRACWPSLDRIADELDTSKSTVQRSISELEDQGLIKRFNPELVSHIPEWRRPTVWTLNIHIKRSNDETGSNVDSRGSNVDHPGVSTLKREGFNVDHLTQREPKVEPKDNPNPSAKPAGEESIADAPECSGKVDPGKGRSNDKKKFGDAYGSIQPLTRQHWGELSRVWSQMFKSGELPDHDVLMEGLRVYYRVVQHNRRVSHSFQVQRPANWLRNCMWLATEDELKFADREKSGTGSGYDELGDQLYAEITGNALPGASDGVVEGEVVGGDINPAAGHTAALFGGQGELTC